MENMVQQTSTPVKNKTENLKKIATTAIRRIDGFIARNEKRNYEIATWEGGVDLNSIAEDSFPDKLFHPKNRPFREKDFPQKWD